MANKQETRNRRVPEDPSKVAPIGSSSKEVDFIKFYSLLEQDLDSAILGTTKHHKNSTPIPPKKVVYEKSYQIEQERNLPPLYIGEKTRAAEHHKDPNKNQDNTFSSTEGLFAVFDGVGGSDDGKGASETGASVLENNVNRIKEVHTEEDAVKLAESLIRRMNRAIRNKVKDSYKTMETTCSGVFLWNTTDEKTMATFFYVGDSRASLYINEELLPCTLDKVYKDKNESESWTIQRKLSEATKYNDLTPEEQDLFDKRHKLKESLGSIEKAKGRIYTIELDLNNKNGCVLVLTTDGVHDNSTHSQMEATLSKYKNPQQAAEKLVEEAVVISKLFIPYPEDFTENDNIRAKDDDITALVIQIGGKEEPRVEKEKDDDPFSIHSIKQELNKHGYTFKVKVQIPTEEGKEVLEDNWLITGFNTSTEMVQVARKNPSLWFGWVPLAELKSWNQDIKLSVT